MSGSLRKTIRPDGTTECEISFSESLLEGQAQSSTTSSVRGNSSLRTSTIANDGPAEVDDPSELEGIMPGEMEQLQGIGGQFEGVYGYPGPYGGPAPGPINGNYGGPNVQPTARGPVTGTGGHVNRNGNPHQQPFHLYRDSSGQVGFNDNQRPYHPGANPSPDTLDPVDNALKSGRNVVDLRRRAWVRPHKQGKKEKNNNKNKTR